jgi:hypothetical protein
MRCEWLLLENSDNNLQFPWSVGLAPDDPIYRPSTFTKSHERVRNGKVIGQQVPGKLMGFRR